MEVSGHILRQSVDCFVQLLLNKVWNFYCSLFCCVMKNLGLTVSYTISVTRVNEWSFRLET